MPVAGPKLLMPDYQAATSLCTGPSPSPIRRNSVSLFVSQHRPYLRERIVSLEMEEVKAMFNLRKDSLSSAKTSPGSQMHESQCKMSSMLSFSSSKQSWLTRVACAKLSSHVSA